VTTARLDRAMAGAHNANVRRYLALIVFAVALLVGADRGVAACVAVEDTQKSSGTSSSLDRPAPPANVPQFVGVAPAIAPATTLDGHPDAQRVDVHRPAARLRGFALAATQRGDPSRNRLFPLLI
jgi:hypothetical protein